MVFDVLNRLSEIPIHKFKKIGSGVVYYNDLKDLMDLELFGGSIQAGSDGVKQEFSQIAHTLNKIGVINNDLLSKNCYGTARLTERYTTKLLYESNLFI